jgi:3-keto-disaccharide hydrolase
MTSIGRAAATMSSADQANIIVREDFTMPMTSTRALALASGLLVAGVAALQVAPPAVGQTGPGWVQLFDGKTMNGFDQVGTANWRVEDGALVADKSTAPYGQGGGHLVTKNSYKNHMIYAEFWTDEKANSGIFVRCKDPKKIGARECYEMNIFDSRPDPSYGTGAIVYHAEANPVLKAAGKWNTFEILADKRHLTITLNGTKTADVINGFHEEGHFTLQWGDGVVKFRKVAVKTL